MRFSMTIRSPSDLGLGQGHQPGSRTSSRKRAHRRQVKATSYKLGAGLSFVSFDQPRTTSRWVTGVDVDRKGKRYFCPKELGAKLLRVVERRRGFVDESVTCPR
jgi:hypothetical protein